MFFIFYTKYIYIYLVQIFLQQEINIYIPQKAQYNNISNYHTTCSFSPPTPETLSLDILHTHALSFFYLSMTHDVQQLYLEIHNNFSHHILDLLCNIYLQFLFHPNQGDPIRSQSHNMVEN